MKAYSRDLRIRALEALDQGTPRSDVVRLFGVSTATLTRWRRRQRETGSLAESPRPGPPAVKTVGLSAALEARLPEQPDATLEEHCGWWEGESGVRVSHATMSRAITALGWTRKKKTRRASERDETTRAAWREQTRDIDPARFVWVDETGSDLGMTRPYSRAPRGQRAYGAVPGRRGKNRTLITALTVDGFGPGLLLDEAIDQPAFDAYIIQRLVPTLEADQLVVVDNLKVHYSDRAKAAIEAKGAQLRYLPTYSPDLTPIEEAFSKFKAALRTSAPRTVEAHSTAVWAALRTITPQDAAGWITHAGYGPPPRPPRPPRQRALPGVSFRFPDPHPAVVLPVPTSTVFDHLW